MNRTLLPTAGLNSIFYRIADDVSSGCSSYVYVLNRFSAPLLPNTHILEVEHDFIPLDGADVFQWREIDSIGDRVALAEAGRFPAALRISRTSLRRFLSHVSTTRCGKTLPIPRVKTADLASGTLFGSSEGKDDRYDFER